MTDRTHPCPGRCGAEVAHAQLACKPCWFRLPKPLRDDVNDAYRNRRRDGSLPHMRAVSKAYGWYNANFGGGRAGRRGPGDPDIERSRQ